VSQAQWIAHLIIEGVARLEPHNRAGLVVVLQVLADPWQIDGDGNAVLAKQLCRADARKLKQLGGLHRASREDHFALGACGMRLAASHPFHADGAPSFQHDARGMRCRGHFRLERAKAERRKATAALSRQRGAILS
jgi:hypothetical protein